MKNLTQKEARKIWAKIPKQEREARLRFMSRRFRCEPLTPAMIVMVLERTEHFKATKKTIEVEVYSITPDGPLADEVIERELAREFEPGKYFIEKMSMGKDPYDLHVKIAK